MSPPPPVVPGGLCAQTRPASLVWSRDRSNHIKLGNEQCDQSQLNFAWAWGTEKRCSAMPLFDVQIATLNEPDTESKTPSANTEKPGSKVWDHFESQEPACGPDWERSKARWSGGKVGSLPVIQARFPDMAAQLQRHLGGDNARCLTHADAARRLLITEGWGDCPNWHDITSGLLAAPHAEASLGDWPRGWQFHVSQIRNLCHRDRVLLSPIKM